MSLMCFVCVFLVGSCTCVVFPCIFDSMCPMFWCLLVSMCHIFSCFQFSLYCTLISMFPCSGLFIHESIRVRIFLVSMFSYLVPVCVRRFASFAFVASFSPPTPTSTPVPRPMENATGKTPTRFNLFTREKHVCQDVVLYLISGHL